MPSFTRLYRYVRFRKGHGVHSPFAFGLINKVIEEKRAFYVFEEIETSLSGKAFFKKPSAKYGRLLFRLVNFFRAKSVLQVGASEGWQALYLNAAAKQMVVLDKDAGRLTKVAELNAKSKSLRTMEGVDPDTLEKAIKELNALDVLFLNVSGDAAQTRRLFDACLPHVHPGTVLIIDGIHKKGMKKVWEYIRQRNDVPVTMDLYSLGLVFFNRKMYKKNYNLYF